MPHTPAPPVHARFRLRLSVGDAIAIGPGKIALLEAIAEHRSLNAAAKAIGMSYKRAWDLINELNSLLHEPAVMSVKGGASGGGTTLTEVGVEMVTLYRWIEARAALACQPELDRLSAMIATHQGD